MEFNILNKINDYSNPYIALAQIANNNGSQGCSIENLFHFINNASKDNINDLFFTISSEYSHIDAKYTRCYSINKGNILDVLGGLNYESGNEWFTNKPSKLFDLLSSAGFDFTKETTNWLIPYEKFENVFNEIKSREDFLNKLEEFSFQKKENDSIFGVPDTYEERNICLIGHAYKQMTQDEFKNRVIKYKTLHNAVAYANTKLIQFLIEECKIDPNIKDEEMATPLFYCRVPKTLEILNQYKVNWFKKNISGKDCLSSFAGLKNKEDSKQMSDFAQKRMSETVYEFQEEKVSPEYIKERVKQSLLEMVQADRTKKELEDFIKKNKITSFSDILDDEGNSLAQICLKKLSWAKYEIFKKYYPLEHSNKDGVGYLEMMFSIYRPSYIDKARAIMNELIHNDVHKKKGNFSFNIIVDAFKNSKMLNIPYWYFNKNKSEYSFAKDLIGEEFATKFSQEYKQNNQYMYRPNYYEKESKTIKPVAYLLLTHASIYGKDVDINVLPIDEMFTQNKEYDTKTTEYSIDNFILYNFLGLIETIDENKHLQKFDYSKIWGKFEQKAVEHLIKSYHTAKKNNIQSFISDNKLLINTLIDRNNELFKSMINEEFVESMRIDKELGIKLDYIFLNCQIQTKDKKITKVNKI